MTNIESQGAGEWRIVEPTERAKSRGVQTFIHKQDGLMLGMPGLVILEDPLADDMGPEGVVDYLNSLETAARELSSLRETVGRLEAKAALADEEWGGDIEGHIDKSVDAMGRKSEECTSCGMRQWGPKFGERPFPHYFRCRKERYDALTSPEEVNQHEPSA